MKLITLKRSGKDAGRRGLYALACMLLLGGTAAFAQISAYSRTPLSGLTYAQISGGTVINADSQLTSGNQNDGTVLVTLPFTFTYDGTPFTQVTFSTNGWIGMGNQAAVTVSQASYLFSVNAPNNTIAPWTGNLGGNWPMPAGNGSMVHGLVGTDAYAFEWRNVNSNSAPAALTTADNVNFTVVLYGPASATPGRIEFLYGPTTGSVLTGVNKAIGIENSVGGTGNYLNAIDGFSNTTSSANAWPGNGTGYRFDPPVACNGMPSAGAPLTALTTLCNGAAVPVINVTGITAATGLTYQWEESTNGGTSWANATGGTGATLSYYTPPVFAGTAIQYRLRITCTNSGQVAYSAPTTINPQSAPTTQATGLVVYNGGNGLRLNGRQVTVPEDLWY